MLYLLQPGTLCKRCRCVILPHESYVSFNLDGCIVFVHADTL